MTQAQQDAINTAKARIAEEWNALDICIANGYRWDAKNAANELAHFLSMLARLQAHT